MQFTLVPAGYLIVTRVPGIAMQFPANHRLRWYRGVDRLPPQLFPDPTVAGIHHREIELIAAVEEWHSLHSDLTAFVANWQRADTLFDVLQSLIGECELLYCEVAIRISEGGRRKDYPPVVGGAPFTQSTFGYDVSWPGCNHSAIAQPGVVPDNANWLHALNERGLLDEFDDALRLRDEYLRVYPHPPFDIFLVQGVEKD